MSINSFGLLSNFDHKLQVWGTFKSRLSQWFLANDIGAENDPAGVKRRAYLLSALAEDTYQLVNDLALPKDVQQVPYEDVIKLLDGHFTPRQVGFSGRHNFYAAEQLPTESASQWGARLRGLTAHCNFTNVEEALRDRFVMGMLPGPEKEKLYVQELSGLTLTKAVELVENLKAARAAAATATASTSNAPPLFKIDKMKNNDKNHRHTYQLYLSGF